MTPGERIRQLRREHGMTQEDLGKLLGIQKAAVNKYESGRVQNIKRATLIKLAQILETTPEDLLGWSADMPKNIETLEETDMTPVPIIGRVAAGLSCVAENDIVGYENVTSSELTPNEQYAFLRVQGDSMYPIFIEGDLVLIRIQPSVDSGSYAVVTIDDADGVIKRVVYGKSFIELQSVNPMYAPRRFEGADVQRIRVFGLVKEIKRKF